jgi:hypothetical protein
MLLGCWRRWRAIGHDLYVFKEAGSGGIQVLYRRKSGGYGMLVLHA